MNTRLPLPLAVNRPLFDRLQREWQAINRRPAVLRRAGGWGLGVSFDCLDELVVATGFWTNRHDRVAAQGSPPARSSDVPSGNAVLARLLLAARTDDVAARVVLQRMLPGLVARARRWGGHRVGGSVDAFDELISAAWMVIREFPLERRPRHLAANLLRDSEYGAFERASRRLLVHQLTEPHLLDLSMQAVVALDPIDELAEVVANALSLTKHDLHLIALLAQGHSSAEVASVLQVSERTVRYHRDSVLHRLRAAALAA